MEKGATRKSRSSGSGWVWWVVITVLVVIGVLVIVGNSPGLSPGVSSLDKTGGVSEYDRIQEALDSGLINDEQASVARRFLDEGGNLDDLGGASESRAPSDTSAIWGGGCKDNGESCGEGGECCSGNCEEQDDGTKECEGTVGPLRECREHHDCRDGGRCCRTLQGRHCWPAGTC